MVFCGGGGGGAGAWLGSCGFFVSRRAAGWAELWVVRGRIKGSFRGLWDRTEGDTAPRSLGDCFGFPALAGILEEVCLFVGQLSYVKDFSYPLTADELVIMVLLSAFKGHGPWKGREREVGGRGYDAESQVEEQEEDVVILC